VFAQLVDDAQDVVVDNQITPIAVQLDGKSHTLTVPLEMISQRLAAGETVTLQLVATTVAYAPPRFGGRVSFTKIHVELPVVRGLTRI
jgi:ABC-2 type transport system ATP-binding protein